MATVLVIEDDSTILENTLELLELEGFSVIGATNGMDGLQQAIDRLPDVIICDVMMPLLDGYGVLREIRANPVTSGIPLIFVSATPREEILAISTKLGVSDYLIKPFRATDLLRIVRKQIGNHAAQ
ncbi:MAG: response regulator [Chloroflexota bacterium]